MTAHLPVHNQPNDSRSGSVSAAMHPFERVTAETRHPHWTAARLLTNMRHGHFLMGLQQFSGSPPVLEGKPQAAAFTDGVDIRNCAIPSRPEGTDRPPFTSSDEHSKPDSNFVTLKIVSTTTRPSATAAPPHKKSLLTPCLDTVFGGCSIDFNAPRRQNKTTNVRHYFRRRIRCRAVRRQLLHFLGADC